jgi:hypothetical protein
MNTLVWSYDKKVRNDKYVEKTIDFYKASIRNAKQLGYKTVMYSNSNIFDNLVDEVHHIDGDYVFWDAFKFVPLLERDDEFCLIDGDLLLHKRLPTDKIDADIIFDVTERRKFNWYYTTGVKLLDSLHIHTIIPEWKVLKTPVFNCGLLIIRDKEFRKLYIDRWKTLHQFCKERMDIFSNKHFNELGKTNNEYLGTLTTIAAQYLLTILAYHYNKSWYNIRRDEKLPISDYYVHYIGAQKFHDDITGITLEKTIL